MDEITFSDFAASGYSYIPVIRQLPLSHTLSDLLRCFPESSVWQLEIEQQSYVYLTLDYQHSVTAWGDTVVAQQGQEVHTWSDTKIWSFIEDLHAGLTVPPLHERYPDLPPLIGGMIGLLPRMPSHSRIAAWPDALWLVMKTLIIMDPHQKTLWLIAYEDPIHRHSWTQLNQTLDTLTARLTQIPEENALMRAQTQKVKATLNNRISDNTVIPVATSLDKALDASYLAMAYASTTTSHKGYKPEAADFLAYQTLGNIAYWLQQPAFSLFGISDKIHITLVGRAIVASLASPVASPDDALASLLWDSLRNDISKIALPGSMRLVDPTPADGEHHWHQQTLHAQISEDTDAFDVLQACYPSSAFLGVPKADALALAAEETQAEPHPLGCQIAIIGWDHVSFSWVSQITQHWQPVSEIHVSEGLISEEIGAPIMAGATSALPENQS